MNKTTTIIFDGTSLRMPVARGGDVRLNFNGTFEFHGGRQVGGDDVIEVFSALEPPGGGRVWWKIFAANEVFRATPHDFDRVMTHLGYDKEATKNEYYAAKNNALIDWILQSRLHEVISFSVFVDRKKDFWHARPLNSPRNDRVAMALIEHCWAHPNPARNTLKEIAESL